MRLNGLCAEDVGGSHTVCPRGTGAAIGHPDPVSPVDERSAHFV